MMSRQQIKPDMPDSLQPRLTTKRGLGQVSGELFWITLGQIGVASGAIVGVRLLTERLDPTAYGQLALAMTFVGLGQQVLLGPLSGAVLRFYAPAQEAGQLASLLTVTRKLYGRTLAYVAAVGAVIAAFTWALGNRQASALILGATAFAVLSGAASLLDSIQNAARQRVVAALHAAASVWLRFVFAATIVVVNGATSVSAILGYVVAAFLVLISQYWFFRQRIYLKASDIRTGRSNGTLVEWRKRLLDYAWPFITWGLFTWLQISSDRWALETFRGTTAVGLYTVLYQLGYYPMAIVSTMVMQLMMPILFSRAGDASDSARLRKVQGQNTLMVAGSLVIALVGTLLAFWLHETIFALFAGPQYQIVSRLLPLMVLAAGLFATGQLASISIMTANATRSMITPKIVTALIGVIANLAGAYFFGITGVAASLTLFGFIYCVWMMLLQRQRQGALIQRSDR